MLLLVGTWGDHQRSSSKKGIMPIAEPGKNTTKMKILRSEKVIKIELISVSLCFLISVSLCFFRSDPWREPKITIRTKFDTVKNIQSCQEKHTQIKRSSTYHTCTVWNRSDQNGRLSRGYMLPTSSNLIMFKNRQQLHNYLAKNNTPYNALTLWNKPVNPTTVRRKL